MIVLSTAQVENIWWCLESTEIAYKNRNDLSEPLFILTVFKLPSQSKLKIGEGEQGKERVSDASTLLKILRSCDLIISILQMKQAKRS